MSKTNLEQGVISRQFVLYFHFVSFVDISLGASIDLSAPYIDIHLPCGFVRFGFEKHSQPKPINLEEATKNEFGLKYRW